jgi:tRNA pseudouridine38-40 synthase
VTKYALGIEYSGSGFSGWQRQKHSKTIQQEVENALGYVANHAVKLVCAGRTDTGVHAVEQVVHFETDAIRDNRAWVLGANCKLDKGIRLKWVVPVDDDFHARFSAIARSYRYIILNTKVTSALFFDKVSWEHHPLDHNKMHEAAQHLVGEYDFSAFRAAGCQSNTAYRNVHNISVKRQGDVILLDIKANAFLYHMVRNIAGSLIEVGKMQKSDQWFTDVFEGKDRSKAANTASAEGLYFVRAHYPEQFKLPFAGKRPVLF